MIDEKEIEAIADKIRHDKTARKDFCKRVGISEDEFFINQNGDFEIEDMERAYRMGTGKYKAELDEAKKIIKEYVRLANLEKEDTVAIWQLYHKAEAFLKESESGQEIINGNENN